MTRLLAVALLVLAAALSPRTWASTSSCGVIDRLPPHVLEKRFVLFGETHGTNEIPALVGRVACTHLSKGEQVIVALELSSSQQEHVNRFLDSDGSPKAIADLTSGSWFWSRPSRQHDGRASVAMLSLLDALRRFKVSGLPVNVVAADLAAIDKQSSRSPAQQREDSIAGRIGAAIAENPKAVVLGLFGSFHTAVARTVMNGTDYEPAGYQLRSRNVYSIGVTFSSGSAWVCLRGECRAWDFPASAHRPPPEPAFIEHQGFLRREDATLVLETASAAAPHEVRTE